MPSSANILPICGMTSFTSRGLKYVLSIYGHMVEFPRL